MKANARAQSPAHERRGGGLSARVLMYLNGRSCTASRASKKGQRRVKSIACIIVSH